jgi:hypothetical protein
LRLEEAHVQPRGILDDVSEQVGRGSVVSRICSGTQELRLPVAGAGHESVPVNARLEGDGPLEVLSRDGVVPAQSREHSEIAV